jgi:molybdenum cofactor guanylyltransferase
MTPHSLSRAAFVLAGGKSSRMGVDKAFLDFHGRTLLDRALATVRAVCDRVAILGDPLKFNAAMFKAERFEAARLQSSDPDCLKRPDRQALPVIPDIFLNCGPLAGIHAALLNSTADLNLMLAVDMPLVTPDLLEFLFTTAVENGSIVTLARTAVGLQPLCAVYRREFASTAEHQLRVGKHKIDAAFEAIATHIIEPDRLLIAGFNEKLFANLNTPEDLESAEGG